MSARQATVLSESFGERLRRLRFAAGMSQGELARRSALSTAGVGALERGARRAPKRDTIELLAEALALDERERSALEQAAERGRARSSRPRPFVSEAAHNLPVQLTSFIGRADELAQIARLISANRLVTVLGPGGVGKTRAALEVATGLAQSGDEDVRFVELAPLQDGSLIVGRIASALDVRLPAADDTAASLARALGERRSLLLLDSCEHLIAHATEVARMLIQQCPHVKVVATTRERLGIIGEVVYRLPPLAVPDIDLPTIADARSCSALELFVQRALLADPDMRFTNQQTRVLIDVCRRLEGIPLAIELAAAQLPSLGLETLSRRLETSVGISPDGAGVTDRHQIMRDTIAWSYNLLIEPERLLLRRLSIFSGGCTLAAAESVCSGDDLEAPGVAGVLASLVDKSLVNAVIDGDFMRYSLLDSTRTFALERLKEAHEQSTVARRHAQWLAAYGDHVVREYLSKPNLIWLDKFWPEADNVRGALEWATQSQLRGDVVLAGQIAGTFRGLWIVPGLLSECQRWIEPLLERIDETREPLLASNLLSALMQTVTGTALLGFSDRLVAVLRRLDDRLRLAMALSAFAVCSLSCSGGSTARAQDAIDEAWEILAEKGILDSSHGAVTRLMCLGARVQLSAARGKYTEARTDVANAIAMERRVSDDFALISSLNLGAEVEFMAGDIAAALEYSVAAVDLADATPHGAALLANALCRNACVRLYAPNFNEAEAATLRALSVTSGVGDEELHLMSLQNLATAGARRGRAEAAARLLGSIDARRRSIGNRRRPFEEAAYQLLVSSLRQQLGTDAEAHIARGYESNLELATNCLLQIGFGI